jgi:response regulator RpfG family c-di-GMP phosphodiesterase
MPNATVAVDPAALPSLADCKPTLLLVDDEERILRSLKLLFVRDYHVRVTTSGREALEILRREKVHALVSDQRMPEMTGVEILRQAKEISPNTMRLLLTGYSDVEAVIGSINDGEIFRYISKPWQQDDIRRIVAAAAGIALSLESAPARRAAAPGPAAAKSGILLVDAAPETADTLRQVLDEHLPNAYELSWARSLDEAVSILETREVALVISDLRVGAEDATAFLKTLKRFQPHIVAIVLSSFRDTAMLVDMVNQGQIHRFLPKPVRATMTARGVLSAIQRHQEIRLAPALIARHGVDAPPREPDGNLVQRIRGLVRRLALH